MASREYVAVSSRASEIEPVDNQRSHGTRLCCKSARNKDGSVIKVVGIGARAPDRMVKK